MFTPTAGLVRGRTSPRVLCGAALLAIGGMLGLAGCGSTSASSSPAAAYSGTALQHGDAKVGAGAAAGDQSAVSAGSAAGAAAPLSAQGAKTAGQAEAVKPRLIRTAEVAIEVKALSTAAALVRQVADSFGGTVSSETTAYTSAVKPAELPAPDPSSSAAVAPADQPNRVAQPGESVVVLRIPEADLDKAIDRITGHDGIAGIGRELSRTASSQDVTADYADVNSRVATQQASVQRIRVLLAKANALTDVVLLEGELSKREADLEALEARRASLADRSDLATLTVDIRTPEVQPPAPVDDNGFVAGLRHGWAAVLASTTLVLTVLGALLPVAAVAALIGWPILWLVRRNRRRAAPPVPPMPPAPPVPSPAPPVSVP